LFGDVQGAAELVIARLLLGFGFSSPDQLVGLTLINGREIGGKQCRAPQRTFTLNAGQRELDCGNTKILKKSVSGKK
jgi:hypothetical protein